LIVVGSSAGGVEALSVFVATLPANLGAPVILAQHSDPSRQSHLAEILERRSTLPVISVTRATDLEPGKVYVLSSNHEWVVKDGTVDLGPDDSERHRPSVDLLFSTSARVYRERLIAIILTGTGSDGAGGAVERATPPCRRPCHRAPSITCSSWKASDRCCRTSSKAWGNRSRW
jgi:two-component system CheB/CheR fusion protein